MSNGVRHLAMTQTTGRAPRVHTGVPNDGGTRQRDLLGPAPAGHHVRAGRAGSSGSAAGSMPAPFAVPIADRAAFLGVSAQVQHLAVRVFGHIGNAGDPASGHGSTVPSQGQAGHGSSPVSKEPPVPNPRILAIISLPVSPAGVIPVAAPRRFAANRPDRWASATGRSGSAPTGISLGYRGGNIRAGGAAADGPARNVRTRP